tara:strand:- start:134 stop:493 length:360 start_codon:yes stop_codon:yes gene_type:complete
VGAGAVEQHCLQRSAALQAARDHRADVAIVKRSWVSRPQRQRQRREQLLTARTDRVEAIALIRGDPALRVQVRRRQCRTQHKPHIVRLLLQRGQVGGARSRLKRRLKSSGESRGAYHFG